MCYQVDGGRVVFFQAAFNDPSREPSVDRAVIRADAQQTRVAIQDGVISLKVSAIRRLGPIPQYGKGGKPAKDAEGKPIEYAVNVIADPVHGNCAHGLIVMDPSTASGGSFRRLKDGLARLATEAGWTIEPNTPLTEREHALKDLVRCVFHKLSRRI